MAGMGLKLVLAGLIAGGLSACGRDDTGPEAAQPVDTNALVVEATIAQLQSAIKAGDVSCRQVVRASLDRIDAYDQSSGVRAITVLNPEALTRADELDAALARGDNVGSLFCAPVLVKDNFDTHDMATTGGSISLLGQLPPDDAFMVRKLREAGAIVIAKTNMAEWAFTPRQTISSSFGRTANAYDVGRVPAGSSGGTASGVAASFAVAGLGSDTGNSIRGPSSHLALFGIRSTIGLTSRDGVVPLAFDRDIAGPMTRTVEDGARLLNVVAGEDPNDPYTADGAGKKPADYTAFLDKDGLKGARVGVLRALSDVEDADPAVIAIFDQAVEDLAAAGAEIVDPFVIETLAGHLAGDYFCPRFRYDMAQYLKSRGPNAPIKDVMEVLESGQYGKDDPRVKTTLEFFRDFPADIHPSQWETPCPDYFDHEGRQAYKNDVVAAMDAAGIDAIIYPSWNNPPALIDRANQDYAGDNSQRVAPATGLPAVTVPMGYSYGNLPAGLQILGRPYSEGALIKYAYAYEQTTKHRRPPDGFAALVEE
jgi:amidase